jgi:predicted secreted protein
VLVEDWRIEYSTVRPHSALGYLTPTDYAKAWTATHPNSHSGWTNNRGPVTTSAEARDRPCNHPAWGGRAPLPPRYNRTFSVRGVYTDGTQRSTVWDCTGKPAEVGPSSAPLPAHHLGGVAVEFGKADANRSVRIQMGEEAVVRLAENPTTGFVWELQASAPDVLALVESHFEPPADPALGGAGTRVLRFSTKAPGIADIKLISRRSWEEPDHDGEEYNLRLLIT